MINSLLLLDVAPEPVHGPSIGAAGLTMIGIVVLMLTAGALAGLVLLLRWFKGTKRGAGPTVDASSTPGLQPSNPNQP